MKTRSKKVKPVKVAKSRSVRPRASRPSSNRTKRVLKSSKEPSLLEQIARATDDLQGLRSRLANAGDHLPAVGMNRISALESELERLWEMRRREQAAPLRETALTEEEEKLLAYPSGSKARGF